MIDLGQHTLERATHSTSGGDSDGEVLDGVSLSADAARVAFTAFAGNLFGGDANQRADAFVLSREPEPTPEEEGNDGPTGESSVETLGARHISARLRGIHDGFAVLSVSVPAPGRIEGIARGALGDGNRSHAVASGRTRALTKGSVRLTLKPRKPLLAALRRGERITAQARVAYAPASSGRQLHTSLKLTFFSKSSQLRHK
jgi:hypothetical protein